MRNQLEHKELRYLLRVSGIVSRAALTHITAVGIDTNLRAAAIINSTFINVSAVRLIVGWNITFVALTAKTGEEISDKRMI